MTVELKGFAKSTVENIRFAVDQAVRADFQLKPRAVTQTVSISAIALPLETEKASVGTVVTDTQISNLPLSGRNFTQLMLLGPGATLTGGEQATRPNEDNALRLAGGRPSGKQYLLDGVTINDTMYQTPAVIPSSDALEEFKLYTKTYSAAYGTRAYQINISLKGGPLDCTGRLSSSCVTTHLTLQISMTQIYPLIAEINSATPSAGPSIFQTFRMGESIGPI